MSLRALGAYERPRHPFSERDGEFNDPCSLALTPSLDLVVRDSSRVQVLIAPDTMSMARMSSARVAWLMAVARGIAYRRLMNPPSGSL